MYLSVIIPSYNEEKRLPKTLKAIGDYLKSQDYDSEIIVVSDGSKDKTAQVANEMKPVCPNLKVIDNKENHGKGYVTRQGLLEATGQIRLFTDADNSTSIEQVEKLIPEFSKGFDVVIGSRDIKGAKLAVPQPWYRRIVGNIFNLMVQIIVGLWGIWDTQCGFKALSAKAAQDILPKCKIDRWAFDPEILKLAKKMDFKIKEVPITWVNDAESKVNIKGMIRMGIDLLKIRMNLILRKYE